MLDIKDAVKIGVCDEKTALHSNYCAYKFCPVAMLNKAKKTGAGSAGVQKPRAKATNFCIHPACRRAYHATCYSIVHRLVEPSCKFKKA